MLITIENIGIEFVLINGKNIFTTVYIYKIIIFSFQIEYHSNQLLTNLSELTQSKIPLVTSENQSTITISSYSSKESNDNNINIRKNLFNDSKYKQTKDLPPSHPTVIIQKQQRHSHSSSSSPSPSPSHSYRPSIITPQSVQNEKTTESNTHLLSSKSKTKRIKPKHSPSKSTSMSKKKLNLKSKTTIPISVSTIKSKNSTKSPKRKSSSSSSSTSIATATETLTNSHLLSDNSYDEESSNQSSLEQSEIYNNNKPSQSIRQLSATIITPKIAPPILDKSERVVKHSDIDIKDIETIHSLFPLPPSSQPLQQQQSLSQSQLSTTTFPSGSISMSNSTRSESNCSYYYEYCKELANYYQMAPNIKYLYTFEDSIEYFNYNKICFGDYYIILRESHLLLDSFVLKDAEILFNEITRCYNTKREMNYGLLMFSFHFIAAERECDVEVLLYIYILY